MQKSASLPASATLGYHLEPCAPSENPLLKQIALLALIVLALLLVGSFVLAFAVSGRVLYSDDYLKHKASLRKAHTQACKAPHPFMGNIDCEDSPIEAPFATREPLLRIPPLRAEEVRPIRVLVLGGSLAAHLSDNTSRNAAPSPPASFSGLKLDHTHIAQHILNKHFGTRRFEVYNAAIRGGKQPQQLFKLMYLLMLGERYDIVVNLDGFNEIALPIVENLPLGNHALYPRAYTRLVQSVAGGALTSCIPSANSHIDRLSYIPPLEVWYLIEIHRCHAAVEFAGNVAQDPITRISRFEPSTEEAFVQRSIAVWRESSLAIARLAPAYGFRYVHVLQPNQYVAGSKPLSDQERAQAHRQTPYARAIQDHYATLRGDFLSQEAQSLFVDMRPAFRDVQATLYRDTCCHLNNLGVAMLVEKIANEAAPIFTSALGKN